MQGYTDTPVERLEQDIMDVKVYVESLSEFILGCSTPMTIAIQGDWGSGKTSMMNMIKQTIEDKIVPIWFNTWQYSQFDMASYLSTSLLSNFLEKIGAEEESQHFLRSVAKGALAFTKTAAVVMTEQLAGGTIAGNVKEKLAETSKQDSAKALEELRDKIRAAVDRKIKLSRKDRIVVFVDDLDRLAPEKAVELLEVLKVFMDVPNCVFVLAVDYAVVTQGLEKKFGVSVGHAKGKSFFDKIIQLPFAIPIAQYDLSAYINNLLSNMSIVCSEAEINTYREIVDSSIGCNPRSMKRLFNSFILLNTVANKKGMFNEADDIQTKDKQRILFAALCLQTAFEELYEFMIKNRDDLDADFFDGIKDLEKFKTDSAFEEIRKNIPVKDDLYYSRIAEFMEIFFSSLKLDDDKENLSDEELDNLKNILSFSAITANTREEIQPKQGRGASNHEFWKYFLDQINGRSVLFQRKISPKWQKYYLQTGVGLRLRHVTYGVNINKNRVEIGLYIYIPIKNEETKIFDFLEGFKDEIEGKMGKKLDWRRNDHKRGCNICLVKTGTNVYQPREWPEITEFLIEELNNMEQAFNPYLKTIALQLKDDGNNL